MAVRYEDAPPIVPSQDEDELIRQSSIVFPTNSLIDPLMFERLSGDKLTIGFAGNRFFNPFVWQKIVFFRLSYDDLGRVKEAHEIPDAESRGSEVLLTFEWDGSRLSAIRGYQAKALVYERRQQYQENRIAGEEIRWAGKVSHIRYVYNGGQLVSAECEKDESVDGRSRKVAFAGKSSSRTR
jgi:hypothetical protein